MKANCEIESQFLQYDMTDWYCGFCFPSSLTLCLFACFFQFLFLLILIRLLGVYVLFNYYDWRVLWPKVISLSFRCGAICIGVRMDVFVFVYVYVITNVGTE